MDTFTVQYALCSFSQLIRNMTETNENVTVRKTDLESPTDSQGDKSLIKVPSRAGK